MVSPSDVKLFPHSLRSMKSSSSSYSSSRQEVVIASMVKVKSVIQCLMLSHMRGAGRVLSKGKSILTQIFKDIHHHLIHINIQPLFIINRKKNKQVDTTKLFLGSFRMHYNWCSDSHVPPPPCAGAAFWNNSLLWIDDHELTTTNLSTPPYPSWLQEKDDDVIDGEAAAHDIDKMAGAFIANCHEKFKLEKQESDRKFIEMLARSV